MSVVKNDRELSFFFEKPSDREGIYMAVSYTHLFMLSCTEEFAATSFQVNRFTLVMK